MPKPRRRDSTPVGARRPVSIEDVAAAAAVSTATVSRLLNNPDLVAPETAARINKAIEDLGYTPNRFAQGLMTRRSRVLGILLPDIHGEFYSALLRGANDEAHRRKYHLLISSESKERALGQEVTPFGFIDGLALMITEPNDRLWREALESRIPLVVLDADPGEEGVDCVLIDNAAGAAEATRHLLETVPPERLYFVGGSADNFDTRQRARAFRDVLATRARIRDEQLRYGTYAFEWGAEWAREFLRSGAELPIGVLAGNDEIAFGILRTFEYARRHAPKDLRIVGFDDTRLASLLRPTLSTVRVPLAEVGAAAVDALIRRIEDPAAERRVESLEAKLVVRETSTP